MSKNKQLRRGIILLQNRFTLASSKNDYYYYYSPLRTSQIRFKSVSMKSVGEEGDEERMNEHREAILRNTEISRAHLTPEIGLRLLTPNCPLYHSPAPIHCQESDPGTVATFLEPFWSIYWPGGQALTRYVLDHGKELFSHQDRDEGLLLNVLDLGAGCGATAIAAKLRGAENVVANDIDPVACVAIGMNALLNNVRIEISQDNLLLAKPCNDEEPSSINFEAKSFDFIFVGDLLYDEEIAEILEPWLDRQATLRGTRIFVGDPGRHGLTKKLRNKLKILQTYSLPDNVRRENFGFDSATVWQFIPSDFARSTRMEEEIVVDDVNENGTGETQLSGEKPTTIMSRVYIQQGKLRGSQPVSGGQSIVTSQNKVLKHIVLPKTNTSTAQFVTLQTSQGSQAHTQPGKHAIAYLSTIIKPNKSRDSVVIPAGALSSLQVTKPKIVIAPVISQLSQLPTGNAITTQTQPTKHAANLLFPVPISQHSVPAKSNMFNLKINNGQITTDNKGTITVLRESKSSSSGIHPPPLHPLSKMLNSVKVSGSSSDGIKITENADSAVITPIPIKEDEAPPEKRKKTISNILRGSSEKRGKKQNLLKAAQDTTCDVSCAPNSPELDNDKEKKRQNDDDITLIKVVPSEDKRLKQNKASLDDEIKIEIIKALPSVEGETAPELNSERKCGGYVNEPKEMVNNCHQNDPNFDPAKVLDWQDGVGTLPGSTLKFHMNEFGMMEMVEEDDGKQTKSKNSGDKENVYSSQNSSNASPPAISGVGGGCGGGDKKIEEKKSRPVAADTIYCCESCGCYGLAAEFENPTSCGPSCTEIIEAKKVALVRKEKDLKDLRAKRKRKRLLQEQQHHHHQNNHQQPQQQQQQQKQIQQSQSQSLSQTQLQSQSQQLHNQQLHPQLQRHQSESDDQFKEKSETDEEVKYSVSSLPDENQEDHESKYPWQTGKLGFSWAKYLEHTKAKAAPVKLFKDAFPYSKNHFKVGMKLEGIDPEHPSHYCVLTVVEVVGYRIRLHFDGYPENYDFWVNGDSMDIFPVGWAEKNGHKLDPPKGYVASNFNWTAYLKTCKAPAAPKNIFSNKNTLFPTGFRQGMKLEAVDRKHSSLVCVASIAELMDSRILVHFDSWDEVYDYWADASSPYIHPIGWCHHNGHSLTPPNSFKDPKSFTWEAYLRETRSFAAPARAFKQRPPCGFKRGMKLEAVDKRVPQLIRVVTVEDVKDHVLKIRFDGWPEQHAYWVDDDSPDIHPMGWCLKTGHPLEPPLTPENLNDRPECGTHGCRGIGHVKGPKYATHNSASGCPYSPQNLNRHKPIPDRLNVKQDSCDFEEDLHERPRGDRLERIKMERSEKSEKYPIQEEKPERIVKIEKIEPPSLKYEKTEYAERSGKFRQHQSDGQTDDDEVSKKRKKRRQISEEASPLSPTAAYFGDSSVTSAPSATKIPDKQLRTEIYHSVYNPGYNPLPDAPHLWAKHSNALNRVVAKQNTDPRRWSNEEVIKFIHSVPNCREIGSIFRKNSIDGEAFLMLTQEDLVSLLGLRLGPAIKLYNSIVLLRRRAA